VSEYADLYPTPEELADLDQVLDEVDALEELGMLDDGPDAGWDGEDGYSPTLQGLSDTLDHVQGSEQLRQSYDGLPLPRTSEERFAQALGRVAEGSYTPGPMYRAPQPSHGCGTVDDFGRCSARYHQPHCIETTRHDAASAGGEASHRWRETLITNQAVSAALDDAIDALDDPGPGPAYEALAEQLGLS